MSVAGFFQVRLRRALDLDKEMTVNVRIQFICITVYVHNKEILKNERAGGL